MIVVMEQATKWLKTKAKGIHFFKKKNIGQLWAKSLLGLVDIYLNVREER